MTPAETDAKAGYCSNCRRGDHTLCASPTCTCPDMRKHRNRPGFAARDEAPAQRQAPVTPITAPKATGIVWEEPPKRLIGRAAVPFLEPAVEKELRANPGRWAKVKVFTSKTSAGSARSRIRSGKTSLKSSEWESTVRVVGGGSALYLRYIGGQQ